MRPQLPRASTRLIDVAVAVVSWGTAFTAGSAAVAAAALLSACRPPDYSAAQAPRSPNPGPTAGVVRVETVARGLDHPWALAFLPDGRMLVTERPGRLRIVEPGGRISQPLAGVPPVQASGQGGLLDVALDPEFASNQLIYLSYAEPGPGGAGTAVARGRLTDRGLEEVQVIYRQEPKVSGGNHFGSRLVFAPDGRLFVTQGERFWHRDQAQNLTSLLGKIVRIEPDGSIPDDNPFVDRSDARPEIWSYGHRNVQAAAIQPETGLLWTVEHGARGGDELNQPDAGKNYGWPVITYGIDYSGRKIGEGMAKAGMEQPVYFWDPVIAPSGMVFYTGTAFPGWKGSILIGSLRGALVRLRLDGGRVGLEERYRNDGLDARIRDVRQGPDGLIYVVTDETDGRVLRVMPAQATAPRRAGGEGRRGQLAGLRRSSTGLFHALVNGARLTIRDGVPRPPAAFRHSRSLLSGSTARRSRSNSPGPPRYAAPTRRPPAPARTHDPTGWARPRSPGDR